MANRVQEVNRELKRLGIPDKLVKGRGYYYFTGPNASGWYTSSVMTYRADSMTVAQWLKEYENLKEDGHNA